MPQSTIIIIAVVVAALIIIGFVLMQRRRTEQLRSQFGAEYDRTLKDSGDRRKAESELAERQKRVEKMDIKPLSPGQRQQFTGEWKRVQAEFVDKPDGAIRDADILIQEVMTTRGYPVKNFDQVAADVSVDHPDVVQNFRKAHDIALRHEHGEGDTEDLRKAMIHYRELFAELVTDDGGEADSKGRRTDR